MREASHEFIEREVLPRQLCGTSRLSNRVPERNFDFYDGVTAQYPQTTCPRYKRQWRIWSFTRFEAAQVAGDRVERLDYLLLTQQV